MRQLFHLKTGCFLKNRIRQNAGNVNEPLRLWQELIIMIKIPGLCEYEVRSNPGSNHNIVEHRCP